MPKYLSTSQSNPCPVCGKTNGNCRTTANNVTLCMTNVGTLESHINGHKNIGLTKDGTWTKFVLENANYNQESKREYQKYQEAQERAKQEQFKGSLSIEERDKNIRLISEYLGLSKADKNELLRRGLNEKQIKEGCYATIKPFSELPNNISTRLAGIYIGRNGSPHIGSPFQSGILCPIFTKEGLISGYQIRREDKENKYVWAVTSQKGDRAKISSHLPNGELPVTVFITGKKQGFLCDGILKSGIAHHRHGIKISGASGGNFLASKKQYSQLLDDGYDIYVIDGGDILNRQVMKRLSRMASWTANNTNHELKFAWYGQVEKNNNDIDEIDVFEYDLLNINELLELAKTHQFLKRKSEQLNKLKKFTPDLIFKDRYVNDFLMTLDIDGKILGVKAPMNCGKSYYGSNLVHENNEKFILIGNRKVLTNKLSTKFGLEYINQDKCTHDAEIALSRATDKDYPIDNGIAIVIDSLLKLEGTNYSDCTLILDEANQVVESLFLSKTYVQSIRGRVIKLLKNILINCKSIILMDANLSDHTIAIFKYLTPQLEVLKVENTYQENNIKLFVHESQEMIKSDIESKLADGKNITIVSDSAKDLTAIHDLVKDQGINSALLTQRNLGNNPKLHRFMQLNGIKIKEEDIKVLFLSPVAQSGISIELEDYFDCVYGLFFGVVGTETARQLLRRVRHDCERHIWISDKGVGYRTEYDPQKIIELEDFKSDQVIIGSQLFSETNQSIDESILNWAKAIINKKDDLKKFTELTTAELIAKNNIEKSDYKEILLEELKAEGYQIEELKEEDSNYDEIFYKEIKLRKKINDWSDAKGINQAPKIEKSEYEILKNKDGLKETEYYKLRKFSILQSLPEFELSEGFIYTAILKDKYRKINGINNYFLVNNPEIAQTLEHNQLVYQLSQCDKGGIFWQYDLRTKTALVKLFEDLDLKGLIESGKTLSPEDRENWKKRFSWHRQKLRLVGITFNYESCPTILLRRVLALFGHTISFSYRSNQGGRYYSVIRDYWKTDEGDCLEKFDEVYNSINKRYIDLIKQELKVNLEDLDYVGSTKARTDLQQDLNPVPLNPNDINSFSTSGTNSNPYTVSDSDLLLEKVKIIEENQEIIALDTLEDNPNLLEKFWELALRIVDQSKNSIDFEKYLQETSKLPEKIKIRFFNWLNYTLADKHDYKYFDVWNAKNPSQKGFICSEFMYGDLVDVIFDGVKQRLPLSQLRSVYFKS